MALDNTRELVAKREREFVQAAHVWTRAWCRPFSATLADASDADAIDSTRW